MYIDDNSKNSYNRNDFIKDFVKVENLTLSYGDCDIVKNIDIKINEGSIVSIIGPNGSGKSTFLKSLTKLIKVKNGEVIYLGRNIEDLSYKELSRTVSILLQKNECPMDLNVEELLFLGRSPHKKFLESKNSKDIEIIKEAMKIVNIEKYGNKKIYELSGGESQRVWLCMALVQEPKLLLLDEPTTYLDIGYQLELLDLIKKINKERKITTIMVLHDLNQAIKYSDYCFVFKNGRVYASGNSDKVINEKMLEEVYHISSKIVNVDGMGKIIVPIKKLI